MHLVHVPQRVGFVETDMHGEEHAVEQHHGDRQRQPRRHRADKAGDAGEGEAHEDGPEDERRQSGRKRRDEVPEQIGLEPRPMQRARGVLQARYPLQRRDE
jgi:hypothetical protein